MPSAQASRSNDMAYHALRGEGDKALAYCRQAGEKACASAHREAVGLDRHSASSRLPETRDTREQAIEFPLDIRNALFYSENPWQILDHLRQAEPSCRGSRGSTSTGTDRYV